MTDFIDTFLDQFEELVDGINWKGHPSVVLMIEMRYELTKLGMNPSYASKFVAQTDVQVNYEITGDQLDRLCELARRVVRNFYTTMREEFNDEAIALMGNKLSFKIGS